MPVPQPVDGGGEAFEALDVAVDKGLRERPVPGLHVCDLVGGQPFDHLVVVGGHAPVGQEEMVDGVVGPLVARHHAVRHGVEPQRIGALLLFQERRRKHLPPRADERVARLELVAEPRHEAAGVDGVEPERDLGQFHRHGVEVYAVDVVVGQVHLHLTASPARSGPGAAPRRAPSACAACTPRPVG